MDTPKPATKPEGSSTSATDKEDYGKSVEFTEADSAGCLTLLGMLVFAFLFFYAIEDSAAQLRSAIKLVQFGSLSLFLESVWDWMRAGAGQHSSAVPVAFLLVGLPLLVWQWFAVSLGRRTLVAPLRLWALSSAYFVAAIIATVGAYASNGKPIPERLIMIIGWSIIPGTFLCISLSLLSRTARQVRDSAATPVRSSRQPNDKPAA
jgi:hypothetical protein